MIAVITAGGSLEGDFAQETSTRIKALLPWRSGCLLDPAVAAARACDVAKLYVIGAPEVGAACAHRVDAVVPAATDGTRNLEVALRLAEADRPLLLMTSDLPFIGANHVATFISRARQASADIAIPLAEERSYQIRFPDAPEHVTRLGADHVANGSIFYFASGAVAERAVTMSQRLFAARKSLPRMAALFDAGILLRFATRRLRITHLEAFTRKRFGVDVRGIRESAPELCFDVDTLQDYHYALAHA